MSLLIPGLTTTVPRAQPVITADIAVDIAEQRELALIGQRMVDAQRALARRQQKPKTKRRKRIPTGPTAIQKALKATTKEAVTELKTARKLVVRVNAANRALAKCRGRDTIPIQWKIVRV